MISSARPPTYRRALWGFLATTVPAMLALGWLAAAVVRQDHFFDRERKQADEVQAADMAVAGLARSLGEFEQALNEVGSGAAPPARVATKAAFVVSDRHGAIATAGIKLPYHLSVSPKPAVDRTIFAAADDLEHRQQDDVAALRSLEQLTESGPATSAEAWLRIARIYKKSGNAFAARAAYDRLAELGTIHVDGTPASLIGRVGKCLLLRDTGEKAELASAARHLAEDLEAGRWLLTKPQYGFYRQQAHEWSDRGNPAIDQVIDAFITAADRTWKEWRDLPKTGDARAPRRVEDAGGRKLLVLTKESRGRLSVMLAETTTLEEAWRASLPAHLTTAAMVFSLSDASRPIVGEAGADLSASTIRAASVTGLPWNVHVARRSPEGQTLSSGTRLMLAGIGLMALVAVGAGYAITRAMVRESRVAQLQSDFVAAVSHEFRTPLTSIRQLSELLSTDRVATPSRRQEFLETIVSESDRLQRLVENLLNFGKIEAGRFELQFAPVDVGVLIDEVVTSAARDGATATHAVEVEVPPSLPTVRGDRQALAHVFRNLLDNAVKYSPGRERVWVRASAGADRVAVTIQDRGLGIPASEQGEIFKKFVRGAEPTAARIKGTGIGLAIAKLIVDAHGGTIGVESIPGEGSTFTVALPVKSS